MFVHTPEKRRHYYVSQIQNKKNKTVTIQLDEAKIVNVAELSGDRGYALHMWMPTAEAIQQVENDVFGVACSKQYEWFKTNLSTEMMCEFFCSCLDANNVCQITVSNIKTPRIQVDGKDVDDFSELFHSNNRNLRAYHCRGVLEVSGLYFYPKKFGIKLTLRTLHLSSASISINPIDEITTSPYKHDVECEWEGEVADLITLLQRDEEEICEKITRLRGVKADAEKLLSQAKNETECTTEWNANLEALRSLIFKYRTGCLL